MLLVLLQLSEGKSRGRLREVAGQVLCMVPTSAEAQRCRRRCRYLPHSCELSVAPPQMRATTNAMSAIQANRLPENETLICPRLKAAMIKQHTMAILTARDMSGLSPWLPWGELCREHTNRRCVNNAVLRVTGGRLREFLVGRGGCYQRNR